MQNYVCGFYFDHTMTRVVLIWKEKPKWQAGKLNGVGGKIKPEELPIEAMRREFNEEAGIMHNEWIDLIILTGYDWRVYFFYALGKVNEFEYAETQEIEEIAKIDIDELDKYPHISNLRWLIPMALYKLNFPEESISFFNPMLNPAQRSVVTDTMNNNLDPKEGQEEVKQEGAEVAPAEQTGEQAAAEGTEG